MKFERAKGEVCAMHRTAARKQQMTLSKSPSSFLPSSTFNAKYQFIKSLFGVYMPNIRKIFLIRQ